MTKSFHARLLVVIVGLVLLAQIGTTAAMFIAARRTADGLADQQLRVAQRLVQESLAARDHEYRDALQALAGDFAFREAVSSRDAPTITSALANHGARISADLVVLMDNSGQVVASTDSTLEASPSMALAQLLGNAKDLGLAPAVASFKGRLLQVVVVPVRAPDTVGWVGMGFILRDFVVDQIKTIAGVEVTLIAVNPGSLPTIAASTIPQSQRSTLDGQMQLLLNGGAEDRVLPTQGEDYLTKVVAVAGSNGQPFYAVLQLPEKVVTGPLLALRYDLLEWSAAVTVLCLGVALVSARQLARPIQALASAARSMQVADRRKDPAPLGGDDVSSLAGAFHALAHRTQYDPLTGLPNRSLLAEWLSASISRAEREHTPLAVVFVDLEGFKTINDHMGRAMGDLVLRKTAQRLLRCVRTSDIVARVGSDEFVLILDGLNQVGALKIIDRLMPVIAKPMQTPNGPIQVSMRAGISIFPDHARDRDDLMQLADAAKVESKNLRQATVVARRPQLAPITTLTSSTLRGVSNSATWTGAPWEGDDLATQPMKAVDLKALKAEREGSS